MIRALVATLATVAALAAACGSPSGDDEPFAYDPIPYTVRMEFGKRVAIARDNDDGCYEFRADLISVAARPSQIGDVTRWAHRHGFAIDDINVNWRFNFASIYVLVPPGSAPDAQRLAKRLDVIGADLAYYGEIPEYHTPCARLTPPPG